MNSGLWLGLALSLLAGILAGNCMLPMKFLKKWAWENMWLVFTVVSLLLMPWALALARVGDICGLYASLPLSAFAAPVLFGFGWGIAQVLFGLSVARLGMALGFAIVIGLGSLLGTLVPLFYQKREVLGTGRGVLILFGLAVMLGGIVVSARAGRLRESGAGGAKPASNYGAALGMAVFCGFLAPMLNYSFAFGDGILNAAMARGVSQVDAAYAVWPASLTAGLIPSLIYSIYLLQKNGTWKRFRVAPMDGLLACVMAAFWMGGMAVYGTATAKLGALGTSLGWALFQIFIIMSANLSGVITGEWKTAAACSRRLLWAGLTLLAAATVVIAWSNNA